MTLMLLHIIHTVGKIWLFHVFKRTEREVGGGGEGRGRCVGSRADGTRQMNLHQLLRKQSDDYRRQTICGVFVSWWQKSSSYVLSNVGKGRTGRVGRKGFIQARGSHAGVDRFISSVDIAAA